MLKRYLLVVLVVTLLTTATLTAGEAASKVITVRLGHGADPVHPWHTAALKFAEIVEQKSNGRVKVQVYTAGQLGNDREMTEAVQAGTLEMAVVSTMAMSAFEPSIQLFDLPYLFPDYKTAYRILDGPIGEKVASKLIPKGLRGLAYWENDFRCMSNSVRPITRVADLKGLKMRVPETPILMDWIRRVGADPTPMAFTELYNALQQEVVDGQDNGIHLSFSARYYEVQKYYTLTNHIYAPALMLYSELKWRQLPADLQKIIQDAAIETRDLQRKLNAELRNDRLEQMKKSGLQVTVLSKEALKEFMESAEPTYKQFENVVGKDLLNQVLRETR